MPDPPVVLDPYSYEFHEDPYPTYARLRAEAPLYHNADRGFWALSRHAAVVGAFKDSERFSSSDGVSLDPSATGPQAERTSSFLAMDPPRHGRMRALVSRGFTPRRVAELEPRIEALTRGYLDEVSDQFDFVTDFAGRLPMDVVSELLGVPPADRAELRRLADLVVHREPDVHDVPPAGMDAALRLAGYYAEMVSDRRRSRGSAPDDLTTALLDAELEVDGARDRLTDDEIIAFLFLMVVAGNETTTKLLAHAWYWGWKFPDERAKPFADPARIGDWVEETLRFDTSSQIIARTARVPVELHGGTIPAGGRTVLLIGSANRDERVFREPDHFHLERPASERNELVSFGFGRHFCLGAALARLETRVALRELVARVADYEIDEAGAARVHSVNVRGFAALPTTVKFT
ncbi:MAG TPA: cytochrome P450 [Acidimicrobiia bacterium]